MWRVHCVCTLPRRVNWPTGPQSPRGLPPCMLICADKNAASISLLPLEQHPLPGSQPNLLHTKQATGAGTRTGLEEGKRQKGRQRRGEAKQAWLERTSTTLVGQGKERDPGLTTGRGFWQYRQHLQHQLQVFHGLDFIETWHWVTEKDNYSKCA